MDYYNFLGYFHVEHSGSTSRLVSSPAFYALVDTLPNKPHAFPDFMDSLARDYLRSASSEVLRSALAAYQKCYSGARPSSDFEKAFVLHWYLHFYNSAT